MFQSNLFHGPSNRVGVSTLRADKQVKRFKELFGDDSEDDTQYIQRKETVQSSVSESEYDDDVLEITIENESFESLTHKQFVSPSKIRELTYVPPFITPIKRTPKKIASSPTRSTHFGRTTNEEKTHQSICKNRIKKPI